MVDWSMYFNSALCLFAHAPKCLFKSNPKMTGNKTCNPNFVTMPDVSALCAFEETTNPTHNGVMKIPIKLERLALKIAAATLPPATPTIITADVTVEGKAAR